MSGGFYLMHRGWLDNPVFRVPGDRYDRRSAWAWLIESAAWADTAINVHGTNVPVARGQVVVSLRRMAAAWAWSEPAVRRFLAQLENRA